MLTIIAMVVLIVGIVLGGFILFTTTGENKSEKKAIAGGAIIIMLFCTAISGSILFTYPNYLVWQQNKEGEAELAKAEQNQQIAVQEAKAKEESAKSLANAEVIRADGVAKANQIIGGSLENNSAYIHWLWIEALKESKDQIIYVPTEAGIPITESARFQKK